MGCLTSDVVVVWDSQRHSIQAPPPCSANRITVKAGTKNRSNCSRERCAGNDSASFASNIAEPVWALANSSSSSFSSRSRSSSRIWNQLTAATKVPIPRNSMLTWPASELA
jgi:hypothetical protein